MDNNPKSQQLIQESEYWFPYHYVTRFNNGHFRNNFLDTWAINYGSAIEFLLTKIDADEGIRIIDIGCGDGRFSRELSIAFQSSTVVGIDYSRRAIALASAMNPDVCNLKFETVDITKDHKLGLFDVAVLMETYEHIPLEETTAFMKSVRGLMESGGTVYLTVPHKNKPLENKHFQHFTVKTICQSLTPFFEVVEIVPFEKRTWLRSVISNMLSNRLIILNNPTLLSMIYQYYKKHLFYCMSEAECQRIFVKAVAK